MLRVRPVEWRDLAPLARETGEGLSWLPQMVMGLYRRDVCLLLAEEHSCYRGAIQARAVARGQKDTLSAFLTSLYSRVRRRAPDPDTLLRPLRLGTLENLRLMTESGKQEVIAGLVEGAVCWLRRRRVTACHAGVSVREVELLSLYRKLGFEPTQKLVCRSLVANPIDVQTNHHFRPGNEHDLTQLATLVQRQVEHQQELAGWFKLRSSIDWLQYVSASLRDSEGYFIVADDNGRLIGYVEVRLKRSGPRLSRVLRLATGQVRRPQPNAVGYVEGIYVRPKWRRNGVATALLSQSFRWLQDQGVEEITAAIWQGNNASENLFRSNGFSITWLTMHKSLTG